MNAAGAALLLTVSLSLLESFPDPAGRLVLFDGLSGRDFFGDRFLWLDGLSQVETEPAAHVLDGSGKPLHG